MRSYEAKKVRNNVYTRAGEWSEYTVREGKTGWIVEGESRITGNRTGYKILIPYSRSVYQAGADLNGVHNDLMTVGEYIYDERHFGKWLNRGQIVK